MQYGHWTVLETQMEQFGEQKRRIAVCRCVCGKESRALMGNITSGKSKSCGCKKESRLTHGHARKGKLSPEYKTWEAMKSRCLSSGSARYHDWGGRGITVCDRWKDDFLSFLSDMGPKPTPQHSLDRINNDGPYNPENCRWTDPKQQARNTRNNRMITLNGEERSLAEWAEVMGLNSTTITQRIDSYGWSTEKALTTPVRKRNK